MTKGKAGFWQTGETIEAHHTNEARMAWLTAATGMSEGDVAVLDNSANSQAKYTSVEGDIGPIYVVAQDDDLGTQAIAAAANGWYQGWGVSAQVNLMSAATTGDWLITSTAEAKARPITAAAPPRGAFARALTTGSTPEAFLFGGVFQQAALDEDRPLKVERTEYAYIKAGSTQAICSITDEGIVRNLWVACDPSDTPSDGEVGYKLPLVIEVDGTVEVDSTVGMFFASQLGSPRWGVDRIGCSKMNLITGESSYYRYVDIPFDTSFKAWVQNISNVTMTVWGQAAWHDGHNPVGHRSRVFHATGASGASVNEHAALVLAAASPLKKGRVEGFMLAVDGNASWSYLEGNIEIEIDSTKTIEYSGTEDAFLGSFYYGDVKWQTNRAGMTKQHTRTDNTNHYKSCFYRFFEEDELPFDQSFQIKWNNGESGRGSPGNITGGVWAEAWYFTES